MSLDFDLGAGGDYVDTGEINGRILIDFELNRSGLMDRIERGESPSIGDKINAVLEDWSIEDVDTDSVSLEYGQLLFKGAEPMEMDPTVTLGGTFETDNVRSTSPEDFKRALRTERTYETTYDELADEVADYLDRQGIVADPSFSAPVHIQATAEPAVEGTNYTITLENNEYSTIHTITVKVDMPPEVGREAEVGHWKRDETSDFGGEQGGHVEDDVPGVTGSYDPEENQYVFDVDGLAGAGEDRAEREIRFYVPARAQRDLQEVSGEARFTRDEPFSDLMPVAVFDAGGHRLDDTVDINPTGHVDATFTTPTADIAVSSIQEVRKEFRVEGVLPGPAMSEIEEVLQDRGITGAETQTPEEVRNLKEGQEVIRLEGDIRNGTVLVGDTRIELNIDIQGERRTASKETQRDADENLPAERRSIQTEYGWTGVTVRGKGTDQQVVDQYIADLRDELQVSLESISEAM